MSIEAEQRPCCGCAYGVLATCLVMPHAPCPHPYPTLARYTGGRSSRRAACCTVASRATYRFSRRARQTSNTTSTTARSKGPCRPASTSAPPEGAAGGSLGDWLGVLLCGDERLYRAIHTHSLATTSTCSPHSPILTYLLTGTTTRWASIIGRSTRSITSLPTRCPLTRVSSTSTF